MTTRPLARLYDRLRVWERIPLLIAAEARGDEAERRRLFAASPLRTWRFSEHLLAEQALHVLALTYVTEQLDAAANHFFALVQSSDDESSADDWCLAADACAYFFRANLDAWRRFCGELRICPDALTAANHRGWFLRYCEEHMPAHAPPAVELQERLCKAGTSGSALVTADSLLAGWRNSLTAITPPAGGRP